MATERPPRIERSYFQRFRAPAVEVFPMLCPVREYEWIEPWKYDLLYTTSSVAELDCVFTTHSEGDDADDVWVISRYEPPLVPPARRSSRSQ